MTKRKFLFQEAHFYGASDLIYNQLKMPICFRSSWMHGLGPVMFREHSDPKVILHHGERNLPTHLVNNEKTAALLNRAGFEAIATGMPIIYSENFKPKEKKSINRLFMPAHIIRTKNFYERMNSWRLLIKKYNCDSICLSGSDYELAINKKIIFKNCKILNGAKPSDPDSLNRIASYFSSTSELITDSGGSHIPYATALGVNVPIIKELSERAELLRRSKDSTSAVMNSVPKNLRANFLRHMSHSVIGDVINLWGSKDDCAKYQFSLSLVGANCKKELSEMRNLLNPRGFFEELNIVKELSFRKIMRYSGLE